MIRALTPAADSALVAQMLAEAQDYFHLWKGHAPGPAEVEEYFTTIPPGCDPSTTLHLGLFKATRLIGLAQVFFGFPAAMDAYLGMMILTPDSRSAGHGARFLTDVETRCRAAGSPALFLAVLEANPRGAAFWARMGFLPTGVSRHDSDYGHTLHRLVKPL